MADGDTALLAPFFLDAVHSFTVDDYHRMGEAGILDDAGRVELIEGVVLSMAPIGTHHFAATLRLNDLLRAAVGRRATVSVLGPVRMAPRSEPEPDIAVLRPREDYYQHALPTPADAFLLVEIADTSLVRDRDVKAGLYARHGIVEYWLFDLEAREVVIHGDPVPADGRYRSVRRVGPDAVLEVAALPGARIALAGVFGAA